MKEKCWKYFKSQGQDMASKYTNNIPRNGLKLCLDANNEKSCNGGSWWKDLSGNIDSVNEHFNINSSAFKSLNGIKWMDFGGSFGSAKKVLSNDTLLANSYSMIAWTRPITSTGNWRTLVRSQYRGANHDVIIENGSNRMGLYNTDNVSGFQYLGYDITSITNFSTEWNSYEFVYNSSSPYMSFYLNGEDSPRGTNTSSNTNIGTNSGIYCIGAYHNGSSDVNTNSQYWGDVSVFLLYNRILSNYERKDIYKAYRTKFRV